MITQNELEDRLKELYQHTPTAAKSYIEDVIPYLITNEDSEFKSNANKIIDIVNTDKYRYNNQWYYVKESDIHTEETFGILKIENIFTTHQLNHYTGKNFIGTIAGLVYNDIIQPFGLYLDGKLVSWDRLELVWDCGDTWLIIRGKEYDYLSLSKIKDFRIIQFPFKCSFIGHEPDDIFQIRYEALVDYIQSTVQYNGSKYTIKRPLLNTSYEFKYQMFNIGAWAYTQMKQYKLGILSEDRIDKLRNIKINLISYDEANVITNINETKYNLLDSDVPADDYLYSYVYGYTVEDYSSMPCLAFDDNGVLLDPENDNANLEIAYMLYIMDNNIGVRKLSFKDDSYIWDLSDIDGLLFRENFLVFSKGHYDPNYKILTSLNNVTFFGNSDGNEITVILMYNMDAVHVLYHSDKFLKWYITARSNQYFQTLINASKEDKTINLPNTDITEKLTKAEVLDSSIIYKPILDHEVINDIINNTDPKDPGMTIKLNSYIEYTPENIINDLSAQNIDTDKMSRAITTFTLGVDETIMPSIDEYIVFISRITKEEEAALEVMPKLMTPLNFSIDNSKVYEDNMSIALNAVMNYDVNLLNTLYHTSISSVSFGGSKANENLLYTFSYENRKGLKIPRERYNDHETYMMIFLNGELFSEYYKTICYANFFFIPVDSDFKFEENDTIEILYFKNVNNNEIRFYIDNEILMSMEDHELNSKFMHFTPFDKWIPRDEMKVFAHYPKNMLMYPTLIKHESEDIAFNITYKDDNGDICIRKDAISHIIDESSQREELQSNSEINDILRDIDVDTYRQIIRESITYQGQDVNLLDEDTYNLRNAFVAVSQHKFIYQRLFVDRPTYRIALDKRFRYCDNPKQYLLFINGRRMRQDSFLITIPKHTRPFRALYLYTATFVKPTDRVELFYLPYDMTDLNFPKDRRYELKENGYLEIDRSILNVPLSKDLYIFFINGKKIPADDIIDIDSSTIRVKVDTGTLHYPMITAINLDTLSFVEDYMHDQETMCSYDTLINYIKNHSLGVKELDSMFGAIATMSDIEKDKLWMHVGKIAILNEVIRDWWVTSGYDYQNKPIVYDYDVDEIFETDERGNLLLPALDASPEINIIKNDISLLYFYTDPDVLLIELGNTINELGFYWEYSQRLNQDWEVIEQSLNGIVLPKDVRSYIWDLIENYEEDFTFLANTGQQFIRRDAHLDYVNGTYWGLVDKDSLIDYKHEGAYQDTSELVAVVPKDKHIPSWEEQDTHSGDPKFKEYILDNNEIIYGLQYGDEPEKPINIWVDPSLANLYSGEFIAVYDNQIVERDIRDDIRVRPDRADDIFYYYPDYYIVDPDREQWPYNVDDFTIVDPYYDESIPDKIYWRDINMDGDSFFAMDMDSDEQWRKLVLVHEEPLEFYNEQTYDVTANGSSMMTISVDDHRVVRYMHYEDMTSSIKHSWDDHDYLIHSDTFMAIVNNDLNPAEDELDDIIIVDLDTNDVYNSNDVFGSNMVNDDVYKNVMEYINAGYDGMNDIIYRNLISETGVLIHKPKDYYTPIEDSLVPINTIKYNDVYTNEFVPNLSYESETILNEIMCDKKHTIGDYLIDSDTFIAVNDVNNGPLDGLYIRDLDRDLEAVFYAGPIDGTVIDDLMWLDKLFFEEIASFGSIENGLHKIRNLDVIYKFKYPSDESDLIIPYKKIEAVANEYILAKDLDYYTLTFMPQINYNDKIIRIDVDSFIAELSNEIDGNLGEFYMVDIGGTSFINSAYEYIIIDLDTMLPLGQGDFTSLYTTDLDGNEILDNSTIYINSASVDTYNISEIDGEFQIIDLDSNIPIIDDTNIDMYTMPDNQYNSSLDTLQFVDSIYGTADVFNLPFSDRYSMIDLENNQIMASTDPYSPGGVEVYNNNDDIYVDLLEPFEFDDTVYSGFGTIEATPYFAIIDGEYYTNFDYMDLSKERNIHNLDIDLNSGIPEYMPEIHYNIDDGPISLNKHLGYISSLGGLITPLDTAEMLESRRSANIVEFIDDGLEPTSGLINAVDLDTGELYNDILNDNTLPDNSESIGSVDPYSIIYTNDHSMESIGGLINGVDLTTGDVYDDILNEINSMNLYFKYTDEFNQTITVICDGLSPEILNVYDEYIWELIGKPNYLDPVIYAIVEGYVISEYELPEEEFNEYLYGEDDDGSKYGKLFLEDNDGNRIDLGGSFKESKIFYNLIWKPLEDTYYDNGDMFNPTHPYIMAIGDNIYHGLDVIRHSHMPSRVVSTMDLINLEKGGYIALNNTEYIEEDTDSDDLLGDLFLEDDDGNRITIGNYNDKSKYDVSLNIIETEFEYWDLEWRQNIDMLNTTSDTVYAYTDKGKMNQLHPLPVTMEYRFETLVTAYDVDRAQFVALDNDDNVLVKQLSYLYWCHNWKHIGLLDPTSSSIYARNHNDDSVYNELSYEVIPEDDLFEHEIMIYPSIDIWDIFKSSTMRYAVGNDLLLPDRLDVYPSPEWLASHMSLQELSGIVAIDSESKEHISSLEYEFHPVDIERINRNFFNILDGIDAELYDNYFKRIMFIHSYEYDLYNDDVDFDPTVINVGHEWIRWIWDQTDRITKDDVTVVFRPSYNMDIRWLHEQDLDDPYIIQLHGDEEQYIDQQLPYKIQNYNKRDVGLMDIDLHKELMYAINNGDATILRGIDYKHDEYGTNEHLVVVEYNNKLYALDLNGNIIDDFEYENHDYSWANNHLFNIAKDDFLAIKDNGEILNNLWYYYDPNRPELQMYYNESSLSRLIHDIDKHLIPEAPYVQINNLDIGNNKHFVFACPKRLVYDEYMPMSKFIFPDITSDEFNNKVFQSSTPIYTDGKIDSLTKQLSNITNMKMVYMGETKYKNDYGYTEIYMVWMTNGYFTSLKNGSRINVTIHIGKNQTEPVVYNNTTREGSLNGTYIMPDMADYDLGDDWKMGYSETVQGAKYANTVKSEYDNMVGSRVSRISRKRKSRLTDHIIFMDDNNQSTELTNQGILLV